MNYFQLLAWPRSYNTQDIEDWRRAVAAAEDIYYPYRWYLIEMYRKVYNDAHLSGVIRTRKLQVTGQEIVLADPEGKIQDRLTFEICQSAWFERFTEYALESIFQGHSLMEMSVSGRKISDCILIPRENVSPQRRMVLPNPLAPASGIRYDQPVYPNLIEVGHPSSLGLLAKAAPLVIYKSFVMSAWTEHAERFGQPVVIGRTNVRNQQMMDRMEQMLQSMSTGTYGVFDDQEKIEFVETSRQDAHKIYLELIETVDRQISKLVTGQTLTADSDGTYGQARVHLTISDDYTKADIKETLLWYNTLLHPFLVRTGYPISGLTFKVKERDRLTIQDKWKIVDGLLKHYEVPAAYIAQEFGIPVEPKPDQDFGQLKKKPQPQESLSNWYAGARRLAVWLNTAQPDSLIEEILAASHRAGDVPESLYRYIAPELRKQAETGYGASLSEADFSSDSSRLLYDLVMNTQRFAAWKAYRLAAEISLADGEDARRSIARRHLGPWMQAEKQLAMAQAASARQWREFQEEKDRLPNLRYETAGDERVRPEHAALDGVVRPADDEFWDTHFPPIDWGCRCDVQQTSSKDQATPASKLPKTPVKPLFAHNPGKSREVFNGHHPYWDDNQEVQTRFESLEPSYYLEPAGSAAYRDALAGLGLRERIQPYYDNLRSKFGEFKWYIIESQMSHLNRDEAHAVWGYTTILFYKKLNEALRGKLDAALPLAQLLDSAISRLPQITGRMYRGLRLSGEELQAFLDLHAGAEVGYNQFLSASSRPEDSFYDSDRSNIRIIFESASGADITRLAFAHRIGDLTGHRTQNEVLISRSARFQVISIREQSGIHHITLRQK